MVLRVTRAASLGLESMLIPTLLLPNFCQSTAVAFNLLIPLNTMSGAYFEPTQIQHFRIDFDEPSRLRRRRG